MRWLAMLPLAALLLLLTHVTWRISRANKRLLERGASNNSKRRNGVLLAQSFHVPLYWLSGSLLALRVALYALVESGAFADTNSGDYGGDDDNNTLAQWKVSAFFWLLEMPSVLLVALYGHLVLFYTSVAHFHHWPTTTSCSSYVSVAYLGFCALLSLLATLFACLQGDLVRLKHIKRHGDNNKAAQLVMTETKMASMHAVYAALVWGVLALLLLKYQAKCTQFLWRERRQHRLRALNARSLHAMAVGSTLLAGLLLLRAIVTVLVAQEPCSLASESFLNELLAQYVGWELVILGVLLKMLSKIPIAYDYSVTHVTPSGSQMMELVFHVPKLSDLISDFVVTTSHSLQQRARLERYDRLFYNEAADEDRDSHSLSSHSCGYCDHNDECECEGSSLLDQAHVALLSAEYPVGREPADADQYDRRSSLSEIVDDDQEFNSLPLYFG